MTSGGYAHHVGKSIALAYVPRRAGARRNSGFEIEILGERRVATNAAERSSIPRGERARLSRAVQSRLQPAPLVPVALFPA